MVARRRAARPWNTAREYVIPKQIAHPTSLPSQWDGWCFPSKVLKRAAPPAVRLERLVPREHHGQTQKIEPDEIVIWAENPATRNRTRDHLIAAAFYSQMLYQLSYSRLNRKDCRKGGWSRVPSGSQSSLRNSGFATGPVTPVS
jgi:NADH:ubiquinone oxidoreductase subunit